MIAAVRISGKVDVPEKIENALTRIRIRRKYSAVLLKPTKENLAILKKLRDYVAFGDINREILTELIKKRAFPKQKNPEEIVRQLEKKSLSELGVKPFFRLHPPRGGIESKKHFGVGKGVLGDNKGKINDLIRRML
ncbi:uL30 family ribosomal protein [Candidatus Pacearchaeota archaeon]|nr:uL30 family ribosomal protein [Candidatus Pacearchaeota archaeon]